MNTFIFWARYFFPVLLSICVVCHVCIWTYPDSKVHGANKGTIWVLSAPDGPHVGPMNLAIRVMPGAACVKHMHPLIVWAGNTCHQQPLPPTPGTLFLYAISLYYGYLVQCLVIKNLQKTWNCNELYNCYIHLESFFFRNGFSSFWEFHVYHFNLETDKPLFFGPLSVIPQVYIVTPKTIYHCALWFPSLLVGLTHSGQDKMDAIQ